MNQFKHPAMSAQQMKSVRGFTLVEIIIVIAVIAILGAAAMGAYNRYVAKSQSSELSLKFDAVRTNVSVALKAGLVQEQCASVAANVDPANLKSEFAALDVAFEAVPGGFTPVMRFCATSSSHGTRGVDVAREAHTLLSRSAAIGKGAVIGEAAVSFTVGLAEGNVACKVAQPAGKGGGTCTLGGSALAAINVPNVPSAGASAPVAAASAGPVVVPPPLPKVQASVMQFAGTGTYVRPQGLNLNTGGDLQAMTLDMTFIGDPNLPAAVSGGPVMFNYGSTADGHNAITLWNPRSLTVALLGANYNTGVNVLDGQTHRIAVAWDGVTGKLALYDNGHLLKSFDNVGKGSVIRGGGQMVIAHKDNSGAGSYATGEAFSGQIFRTSLANKALSEAELVRPTNQILTAATGLLIDVSAESGTLVDTTGRHQLESGGLTVVKTGVEGNLVTRP